MREIKFRAWDGERMRESFLLHQANGKIPILQMGATAHLERMVDWRVMQFTGLHDKNGKDIYEGDIVLAHDSWGKYSGAIEWWNDRWVLRFPGSDGTPQNQSLMTVRGPKVIGNIFESPELWEG